MPFLNRNMNNKYIKEKIEVAESYAGDAEEATIEEAVAEEPAVEEAAE